LTYECILIAVRTEIKIKEAGLMNQSGTAAGWHETRVNMIQWMANRTLSSKSHLLLFFVLLSPSRDDSCFVVFAASLSELLSLVCKRRVKGAQLTHTAFWYSTGLKFCSKFEVRKSTGVLIIVGRWD